MTDTTDDMRTEPDFEAEVYRLLARVAELEARIDTAGDGMNIVGLLDMYHDMKIAAESRAFVARARALELAADNDVLRAEIARWTEVLGRVETWTLEMGASLIPPRADTYGEGMRDAKGQVGRLLRGRT